MFDSYTRSRRVPSLDVELTITEHGPIEGADHWLPLTAPDRLADLLLDWLD